ncbi:flagellin N-terminal helical domain-containing protein [Pseudoroseomonas ludipueritiae]|uniref:Flagellin n=1 Tax=Pseudoroseomonas ludipueritiae TaxID=198093 RepID=A0ABR7RDK1_9PROT|nr:flagellin [Pseudoroseomonas ludipueritiae]MBC9179855.1 flagellin [Pseudoroseomonas ludipueritiae]MCG7361913.1 flagellin [Roseomonas sp. ACRSG]
MVSSILTNNGAMTALQSLKATQKNLLNTQNRISTGLKVSTAKDNAATWAVATAMRSDIANTKQVSENLSVSSSIIGTAETAAEQIADAVKQIRTKVTSAQNPAVDKAQVQADIDGYIETIKSIVSAASFKGVNLINGGGTQRVLTSVNTVDGVSTGAYADVAKQNLSVEDGSLLSGLKNLTVLSRADQTMAKLNDGVQKVKLATGSALALKAGHHLELKYIDETGTDRTLTVKLAKDISKVEDLVSTLNADAGFSAMFTADRNIVDGTATTDLLISAKNRDSTVRLGSTATSTSTGVDLTDVLTAKKGDAAAAPTNALTASANVVSGATSVLEMDFADKALQVGDEFVIKADLTPATNTTDKGDVTYKLKVVGDNYKTGDKILDGSSTADRVFVIAVAASDVTNGNVTGKDIAEKFKDALTKGTGTDGWNIDSITSPVALDGGGFTTTAPTAAGDGFHVSVDSVTGALRIASFSSSTALTSFNSSKTDYDVLLSKVDQAGANVANAAASFGTAATRIDLQKDFLDKLVDTLNTGLGALVDADMSEEAARLQALQVQEQLGTQALSIANQAPQSILRLFQ